MIRSALLFLIFQFILTTAVAQDPDYGKMLVDAINSSSEDEVRKLVKESFSENALKSPGLDPIVRVVVQWHKDYAPMKYHHSDVSEFQRATGSVFVIHVYARTDGQAIYKDFQIYLDAAEPHKLEKIAFIADVAEPVNLPNGSIDQESTLTWLNDYIEKLKTENDLYGNYTIMQGGSVLYQRSVGFEDLAKTRPINAKTKFNIASGGKMFTAVSVAQLVGAGKLTFEDPITKYLTGFSDQTKASKVTIGNLLSHTSGIAEYWTTETDVATRSATNTDDHLKLVYKAGHDFDAGTDYSYSNSNFILLGAVIEKVTGTTFYNYVQKNIFDRAGMTSSGYYNYGSSGMATPMAYNEGKTGWKEGRHGIRGSSAGGAYSTAEDIFKFARALKENQLVRVETMKELVTIHNAGFDSSDEYGYGFMLSRRGDTFCYGHGGTADGVNFEFEYYPREDITFIAFCNQNNGAYDDLRRNITKLINGYR